MDFGELVGKNVFFLYLFAVISVIAYDIFSDKQKISVIYIFTFGITLNGQIDKKIVLSCMLITLFIYEGYLGKDKNKRNILYCVPFKVADFIYMYIFQYKILFVCLAIYVKSYRFEQFLIHKLPRFWGMIEPDYPLISNLCSVLLVYCGIHFMFSDFVQFYSFTEIHAKFAEYPYYDFMLKNKENREELFRKLEMIAELEDRFFFRRKKAYHYFSLEQAGAYLEERKKRFNFTGKGGSIPLSERLRRCLAKCGRFQIKKIPRYLKRLPYGIRKAGRGICLGFRGGRSIIKRRVRKIGSLLQRGHSTIEMQTIRILSYKRGLILGAYKGGGQGRMKKSLGKIRVRYNQLKRKLYEVLYAQMIFSGIKHNLGVNQISELDYYRYYIIYIYLHTVQTKINKHTFRPLDKIFDESDVDGCPIEVLFIIGLGLCSRPVTMDRVNKYDFIVEKYGLERDRLEEIIADLSAGKTLKRVFF